MKHDIVIVGAGVAGLMSAIELAKAGMQVRLLDRAQAGMESSWAGGGILSPIYPWRYPDPVNDMAYWGTGHYPDYLAQLHEETGVDPQWITSGHLILDEDIDSPEVKRWVERYNVNVQLIDQQQLREIEPAIGPQFEQAIWLPDIGQVRNPRLVRALRTYAEKLGIQLNENTPVRRIVYDDGRVLGIDIDSEQIQSERVLLTAGAWSGQFDIDNNLDVAPVKGQMIQFQTEPGTVKRITLLDGRYIIPRKDGKVVAGSTLENTAFDKSTTDQSRVELQTFATQVLPSLSGAPLINHWAGLRPGNDRQTPFVGEHQKIDGLYFNTGHYRNGIIIGLASARLVADLITNREPILSPDAYAAS